MRFPWKLARRRSAAPSHAQSRRPVLAVDVDGVISLFDFDEPPRPPAARFELVDGTVQCLSVAGGERLRRLARLFDIVWATGWEERANQLGALLGLPHYPYLSFEGAARFGSANWKIEPLATYAAGRPVAWIDDSFDEACYRWAHKRSEPTLLIATESAVGLEEVQEEALTGWARSLRVESEAESGG